MEMNQRQCGLSSLFQSSLLPLVQCKPKIHFSTPILTRENPWFHTSRSSLFEISLTAAVSSSTWLPSCPICPIGVWTSTKFWNSKNIQSAIFKKNMFEKSPVLHENQSSVLNVFWFERQEQVQEEGQESADAIRCPWAKLLRYVETLKGKSQIMVLSSGILARNKWNSLWKEATRACHAMPFIYTNNLQLNTFNDWTCLDHFLTFLLSCWQASSWQ